MDTERKPGFSFLGTIDRSPTVETMAFVGAWQAMPARIKAEPDGYYHMELPRQPNLRIE
ncbi:MAG: hypothetical protein KC496_21760 [Anaerolineae bacterium]|nr:hypothetical protein [Anaerolineae bacterium]